ncbi:MAG: alpha/beta fold hydrolase [Desulfurococcales archaeon]|nr:alpha/beta fold hydrolase [Desulfurococcales archaeon]
MHRYSRLVEELVELVGVELYGVGGVVAGERILVSALREGAANLYLYDGGQLVRLNREPINGYARPPRGAGRVVIYRDVARGRELAKLYVVSVERPGVEEELHPEQAPARILGVADDGETVAFAAVHEAGIGVYAYRGGRLWKAADAPGLAMVESVRGDLAAGVGVFPPETRLFKIFTVDLQTGEFRVHEPPIRGSVLALDIAPDGSIVYGLEAAREGLLYRLDPQTGRSEPLDMGAMRDYGPTAFNAIRHLPGGLAVIARKRGRSRVFLDGAPLEAPEGMHGSPEEWRGRILVTHTSLDTPHRIVALDPSGGGWSVVLEGSRPWWLPEALGSHGYAEAQSSDGAAVPLYYLESRRAPRPGPTVVLVHGGPFAEDADAWDIFAAALAAAGFHVVKPNYRGSTGYGLEWMEKIIGDPCGMELEDIAAAAGWAAREGLARGKPYIMGYSYGGYMTLCALTRKPGAFKAGVAGASVADWEEMYELSDPAFKAFIEMLFNGDKSLWRERSPITYIDNLQEPLALIHPQNDTRTPLKPVLHLIEKATEKGKRLEAHIAPDMGHTVNKVEDVVKILLPAALFLARQEENKENKQ